MIFSLLSGDAFVLLKIVGRAARLLPLAIIGLILPLTASAAGIDVELAELVQCDSRTIYLHDVAHISSTLDGDTLKGLGTVKLGVVGDRNAALKFDAKRIAHLIALQQPALSGLVRLSGAPAVIVSLRVPDGSAHETEIRRLIRHELGVQAEAIEIKALQVPPGMAAEFAGVELLRLQNDDSRKWAARTEFVVEGLVGGRVAAAVRVGARLSGNLGVCALKRGISIGDRVSRTDCAWVTESLERLSPFAVTTFADFERIGELNRPLLAGERLSSKDFAILTGGVRRGDRVKVIVRNAGVLVEQYAIALAGALPGEMVRVQNPASGGIFSARVTGGGVVEMEL
jgi:flagella basal body P-ring formation protein FlgA